MYFHTPDRNNRTMKAALTVLAISLIFYFLVCLLLFLFQEKLIFFPQKLDRNFQFHFDQPFEEMFIPVEEDVTLHGIMFKSDASRGLVFYLHGNAGSLSSWGGVAQSFTDLNYDVFILDYRGYGKSSGNISSERQIFQDVQTAYDTLMKRYPEEHTVVLGYSIGTGPASKLAADNHPKLLVLQAPFYSLIDIVKRKFPIIPSFLLKYKFENNKHLKACTMPVVIFHGDVDEVIYHGSSLKLREHFKSQDTLIVLKRQGHNGMAEHADYKRELKRILEKY